MSGARAEVGVAGARALVTGARGFAGRHLSALLRASGCEVWELDRTPPAAADAAAAADRQPTGDVGDFAFLRELAAAARPDLVFHLAAVTAARAAGPDDHRIFEVNVLGTRVLLEALVAAGLRPRVLVTSSSSVYGAPPRAAQPIVEETPLAPQTLYAASKCAQETLALTYGRMYGLPVVVTRAFNHTGPGEGPEFAVSGFARQLAAAERAAQPPVVRVGNLDSVRDFSDVRDVVRGYLAAATRGEPGECYNVCSGEPRTMAEILDGLRALARLPVRIEADPGRLQPSDVPYQCGSFAKLEGRTGWRPAIAFTQTLGDLLDHWRAAPEAGPRP
jgi:GDP-4-dehydro-6-deoxy-D-mannose reductase